MIHNRVIALIFRVGCLIFSLIGLLSHIGLLNGDLQVGHFMYYTIQSNLLGVILFATLSIRTARGLRQDGPSGSAGYMPRFEMVCVIDLLLTLIVYWAMLAPTVSADFQLFAFDNVAVHLVTPLLCLIDYMLFTDSGHLKYKDVYFVLIYPLAYVVFASISGFMGYVYMNSSVDGNPVRFPYFFFDYDRIGAQSLIYIVVLVVFFLILSHGLYLLDRKVRKPVLIGK